ncbi:MAG TPA: hypothetical protein VHA15_05455 [Burkholderiales bacterium]|jgi:hypothetical protein|nr:hypothetical protein [Burkholderiales bacterium]
MNLERITVEFHAGEDRMLLRIFFNGRAEVQCWLTRRLLKRVWPVMLQMAQSKPDIQMQANPVARQAMLGMQHEKALQEVKFSKAPEPPAAAQEREHPLGNAPMLVSKVRAGRNQANQTVLSLLPAEGNGVDLALGDNLLHGVLKLMQDTAVKAEWDLTLAVPTLDTATAEDEAPRTVN